MQKTSTLSFRHKFNISKGLDVPSIGLCWDHLHVVERRNAVKGLLVGLKLNKGHLFAEAVMIKQDPAGLHCTILLWGKHACKQSVYQKI